MKNLTLRQIKIFICAAKHLSFSKAADELNITAAAVSLQMKEMEKDFDTKLFNRDNKKIKLTLEGEHFLIYAIKVMSTLDQAKEAIDKLRGKEMKPLRIGLVSTTRYFFPTVLVEFQKIYPNVQLKVDVKNREQLIQLLHNGEIDIAIMGKPPATLSAQTEVFAKHPHVFIASTHHPLAFQKNLSTEVLNRLEVITREQGSGTRYVMEKFFVTHNLTPLVRIEISGNETIKQAVIANLGVSFVSSHTIVQELRNKQLIILDIQDTPVMREWHVVTPNRREHSLAVEVFRQFVLDHAGEIINAL
ncbi:MAG TPA: LysR substrate-binding domain-containing protein [Methylotenera sp.]|nr:LysR substrate-binding domain-containing protein [Methylotenera sp.]HPH06656.1 LysR substrate-binding domain-containing protein [Methylotenera sp.]HPN01701.1 LysR substrate-binding domain-containing protein [Methylotenera sp.]